MLDFVKQSSPVLRVFHARPLPKIVSPPKTVNSCPYHRRRESIVRVYNHPNHRIETHLLPVQLLEHLFPMNRVPRPNHPYLVQGLTQNCRLKIFRLNIVKLKVYLSSPKIAFFLNAIDTQVPPPGSFEFPVHRYIPFSIYRIRKKANPLMPFVFVRTNPVYNTFV